MINTGKELAAAVKKIATDYKTLYVMGCFGAPLNAANKKRYCTNHSYNKQPDRTAMINAASADTFGFDCVCLIKGVLWGWNGNKNADYGGAKYKNNGVPDIDCNQMFDLCSGKSTDFSKIEVGEAVWQQGHIGIYIGDGLAVECTPSWGNKVQITAVSNIGNKSGYNRRKWTKHGKLPYVTYGTTVSTSVSTTAYTTGKTNAPVNVRAEASINGKIVTKLVKGTAVQLTGKTVKNGGYIWAEILYNGKICYCDKQWINR